MTMTKTGWELRWFALLTGAAALLLLALAPEVWAAAGDGAAAAGGASDAASNFNENAGADLSEIGVIVFGAVACFGLAAAALGKKYGGGFAAVVVGAVGVAIALNPEDTLKTLGDSVMSWFGG